MSESIDSVRVLSEAIELTEMLEILAQNHGSSREGGFPIGGVRLTLRQVTEQIRAVRTELIEQREISGRQGQEVVPRAVDVSVRNGSSSLASRLKPAPKFSGRVRDISVSNSAQATLDQGL